MSVGESRIKFPFPESQAKASGSWWLFWVSLTATLSLSPCCSFPLTADCCFYCSCLHNPFSRLILCPSHFPPPELLPPFLQSPTCSDTTPAKRGSCWAAFPGLKPCLLLCWSDSQSAASAQAVSSLLSPLSPEAVQVPQGDSWANTTPAFCLLLPKESPTWVAGKTVEALEHVLLIFGTCMKFLKCSSECWELKTWLRQGRYLVIAFALSDKESQEMWFWICFITFSSIWIKILFLIANKHLYFPRRKMGHLQS